MLFEEMTKRNLDVVAVTESHLPGDGDIQYRGYPDFHILHHGGVQMRNGGLWGHEDGPMRHRGQQQQER